VEKTINELDKIERKKKKEEEEEKMIKTRWKTEK
jgi:hypothetical protein